MKINATDVLTDDDVELSPRSIRLSFSLPLPFSRELDLVRSRKSGRDPAALPREYPDVCQTFSCRDLSESGPTNWLARQKANSRAELSAFVYVPRWSVVTEPDLFRGFLSPSRPNSQGAARAQDFSITRNETTRLGSENTNGGTAERDNSPAAAAMDEFWLF